MSNKDPLLISKIVLASGLDQALASYRVAALVKRGERVLYDFIAASGEIEWDYKPTVLSPKKFFFPQDETLARFNSAGKVTTEITAKPMVLFGIRPCDLNAIKMMYEAFADGHGDPNYLSRAENALVIGMDCSNICDEHAFCFKVDAHKAHGGYDIMLSDLGDGKFALVAATQKGQDFVIKYFPTEVGTKQDLVDFDLVKERNFGKEKPFSNLEKLPEIFEKERRHPIWDEEAKRCLSCGSCVMVCPTCYCFDVVDDWDLNLKDGQRVRKWDACMLSSFAKVASGESFRPTPKARLQHRMHRKFNYLMKKHKMPVCVGCGRCVRACLAKISPRTIVEAIVGK